MNEKLIPALRQFSHNDGSEGFVFEYDVAITDRLLAASTLSPEPAKVGELGEALKLLNDIALWWHADRLEVVAGDPAQFETMMEGAELFLLRAAKASGVPAADLATLQRFDVQGSHFGLPRGPVSMVRFADVEALFNPTEESK